MGHKLVPSSVCRLMDWRPRSGNIMHKTTSTTLTCFESASIFWWSSFGRKTCFAVRNPPKEILRFFLANTFYSLETNIYSNLNMFQRFVFFKLLTNQSNIHFNSYICLHLVILHINNSTQWPPHNTSVFNFHHYNLFREQFIIFLWWRHDRPFLKAPFPKVIYRSAARRSWVRKWLFQKVIT